MAQLSDFSDPMNPTPEELAMARAYALRGIPMPPPGAPPQQQQQPQGDPQRALGLLSLLSGNKALGQFGESAVGDAQQRAALQQRQPLIEAETAAKNYQLTPQSELGGKSPSAYELLTKRQSAEKYAVNPVSGAIYDVRTGQVVSNGGSGSEYDKRLPGMQEKFAKDLDPNNFRSGVLKGNQERINAADRLLTLAKDPLTGGPANLTPQQMTELSTSLAALLGGGSSSEGSRHELTPYTKGRTMAGLMQWLTDAPQGAEQQAFVKQMIDTATRERAVAEGQIRSAQAQRFPSHLSYFGLFGDAAKAQLQGFGFDPSEVDFKTGKYNPKKADARAAPDATSALRKKYGL